MPAARPKPPLPGLFLRAQAEYPEVLKAYEAFARATEKSGPLSRREQRLVKLGLTFGARMEGASHSAVRKALEAGLSADEIRHAALLAMPTIGFPNAMACLSWINEILEGRKSKGRSK